MKLPQATTKSCVVVTGNIYHCESLFWGCCWSPWIAQHCSWTKTIQRATSTFHIPVNLPLALLVHPVGFLSFQGEHGGSCGVKNHQQQHPLHGAVASVCSDNVGVNCCPTSGCGLRGLVLRIHILHVLGFFLLWTRSGLVLWTECPPGTAMPEFHSWKAPWLSPGSNLGHLLWSTQFQWLVGTEERPGLSSAAYEMNLSHGFSWSSPDYQIQKCLPYIAASVPGITN